MDVLILNLCSLDFRKKGLDLGTSNSVVGSQDHGLGLSRPAVEGVSPRRWCRSGTLPWCVAHGADSAGSWRASRGRPERSRVLCPRLDSALVF